MSCYKPKISCKIIPKCTFATSNQQLPVQFLEENNIIKKRCSICLDNKKIIVKCKQCNQCQLCQECIKNLKKHESNNKCPFCKMECNKCLSGKDHVICDWMESTSYLPSFKIDIKMPAVNVIVHEDRKQAFLEKWLCLNCSCQIDPEEGGYVKRIKFGCKFTWRMILLLFGWFIFGMFISFILGFQSTNSIFSWVLTIQYISIGFIASNLIFYCGTRCCCHADINPIQVMMA
jgi:hypothetical protein